MKKTRLILFLIMISLPAAAPAAAETFTGGIITVEVPSGWAARYDLDGVQQVFLASPDGRCQAAIMAGPSAGLDLKGAAEMLAGKMEPATTPEPGPEPGTYRFYSTKKNGEKLEVTVATLDLVMLAWMQSGSTAEHAGDLKTMWNSLSSPNPRFQALFETLPKR